MAWLVVALLSLVAIGNLVDFLLGPPGQRRLKDRLVDWYVLVAGGTWTGIVQSSARTASEFFSHLFGARTLSSRAIAIAGIGSCFLTALVLLISLGLNFWFVRFLASDPKVRFWNCFNMFCIVGANAIVDVGSVALTRRALKTIERTNSNRSLALVLLTQAILTYISLVFVMALTESVMLIFSGGAFIGLQAAFSRKLQMVRTLFFALFPTILKDPWKEGSAMSFGGTNLFIFGCIAALPALFSVFVLAASGTLRASRRFTQRPIALLLERLEGSRKGLFTIISVALSTIAGLIAALAKARG